MPRRHGKIIGWHSVWCGFLRFKKSFSAFELLAQALHDIEKRIIAVLRKKEAQTAGVGGSGESPRGVLEMNSHDFYDMLVNETSLSLDQIRRGMEWLKLKHLIHVESSSTQRLRLGKNGEESFENGLPERRLLNLLQNGPQSLSDLQKNLGPVFGPAMGRAKKNGWIKVSGNSAALLEYPKIVPGEERLKEIKKAEGRYELTTNNPDSATQDLLTRPGFLDATRITKVGVALSDLAKSIDLADSDAIDVEADVPSLSVARRHPLKDVINEIREIFVTLGFSEISGNLSQSSFWNFDALFTPQDHPAREMQDTFYLDSPPAVDIASEAQIKKVSESHQKNWRYRWDVEQARRMVLRTHTTCVTIRHLAETRPEEARFFSLGRVFRNEKVSYKHLVEFNQVEGVVVGKNATLRDLMGIQKEFYRRIGITKVKFWPTFFPYTEPSLQTMVYNDKLGKWVELFGMGIFRPEVTKPLGFNRPVLAWGGGIERIAMLRYDLDDVREFYNNNLNWLRGAVKCQ